jgi:phage host-nuclease inhibitor protein Gam
MSKKKSNTVIEKTLYSTSELEMAIGEVADIQRDIAKLNDEANADIKKITDELALKLEPLKSELQSVSHGIKSYCDANKESLFEKDSKTKKFLTGEISYRKLKDAVITKMTQKALEEILEKNNLLSPYRNFVIKLAKIFLTVKIELDKNNILKQENQEKAKTLIDVKIRDDAEGFYIKPAGVETEIEMEVEKAA